jgi:UDP-N-acetylmuramyl pentapeptide phosphotransferase/UDP-N-acetylglucosamine-1-phosphate transferase
VNLIAIAIVPFAVSLFVCWLMIRLGPKDAPDGGRKTQAAPVPSSGGIGVLAGLVAGAAVLAFMAPPIAEALFAAPIAGIAAFTVFAALLGWADDVYGLPALTKLVALLGAAAAAVIIGPQPGTLWIDGAGINLPWALGAVIAVGFIFIMANAVNFMDGANGIAMGASLIILAALGLMRVPNSLYASGDGSPDILMAMCFIAAAALAGFLVCNLPGKLFAGDAGSLSVGGLIGGASVMFAMNGLVLIPLTLCLPILIDVFLTLAWRARHGRPLMQAHRDHAYQLLLRAGWPHGKVARLWWGMTAICAGAVIAGPFASPAGLSGARSWPLDVIVFSALLMAGCGLWVRQRVTLGRELMASGR